MLYDYEEPLRLAQVQVDDPGPGEVLVRIAVAGVCHTDEHVITGDLPLPVPMVLGHEGSGVVAAVGEGVSRVRPGERVVLSWLPECGECVPCRQGWQGMCETTKKAAEKGTLWRGRRGVHLEGEDLHVMSLVGAFADYALVPEGAVVHVPDDVPLELAALIGCSATTGYGAVAHAAAMPKGATVAVIGVGGVGQSVVMAARMQGAGRIIAVDPSPERLADARRHGATDIVQAGAQDALQAMLDLTDGYGVDRAFEVVGTPETIAEAFNALRPGGTAVVVGVSAPNLDVSLNAFTFPSQEKTLTGTWYGSGRLDEDAPELFAASRQGRFDLASLKGPTFALEDINAAFDHMRQGLAGRPLLRLSDAR